MIYEEHRRKKGKQAAGSKESKCKKESDTMTIDEKLTRLEQEIDSLDSAISSLPEGKTGSGAQIISVQIAARFESCEMVLKSLRRDIADKDKADPVRASVLSLRDRLSALLDRYEAQSDSE